MFIRSTDFKILTLMLEYDASLHKNIPYRHDFYYLANNIMSLNIKT